MDMMNKKNMGAKDLEMDKLSVEDFEVDTPGTKDLKMGSPMGMSETKMKKMGEY